MSYLPVSSFGALTMVALGFSSPIRSIASRNSLRSSAISMASRLAPIISTPNFASTPISSSASEVFRPVCPPMVGNSASGRSFSMILATTSGVIGSI
jgi:hypothetical protein